MLRPGDDVVLWFVVSATMFFVVKAAAASPALPRQAELTRLCADLNEVMEAVAEGASNPCRYCGAPVEEDGTCAPTAVASTAALAQSQVAVNRVAVEVVE